MKKKIIAMLLAVVMVLALCPLTMSAAAGDYKIEVTSSTNELDITLGLNADSIVALGAPSLSEVLNLFPADIATAIQSKSVHGIITSSSIAGAIQDTDIANLLVIDPNETPLPIHYGFIGDISNPANPYYMGVVADKATFINDLIIDVVSNVDSLRLNGTELLNSVGDVSLKSAYEVVFNEMPTSFSAVNLGNLPTLTVQTSSYDGITGGITLSISFEIFGSAAAISQLEGYIDRVEDNFTYSAVSGTTQSVSLEAFIGNGLEEVFIAAADPASSMAASYKSDILNIFNGTVKDAADILAGYTAADYDNISAAVTGFANAGKALRIVSHFFKYLPETCMNQNFDDIYYAASNGTASFKIADSFDGTKNTSSFIDPSDPFSALVVDNETIGLTLSAVATTELYIVNYRNRVTGTVNKIYLPAGADIAGAAAAAGIAGSDWYYYGGTAATTMPDHDITVYTGKCTVNFYFENVLVESREVCFGEKVYAESCPAVPAKYGYKAYWNITPGSYITINLNSFRWNGQYVIDFYVVQFVADMDGNGEIDTIVDTVKYNPGEKSLSYVPVVPAKAGYTAYWEPYTLNDTNLVVKAVYNKIEETTVPEETTEAPEETTEAPEETTEAPEETTEAPEETTLAPEETTLAPEETTVAPEVTTAPVETTPVETTPVETTPVETKPVETEKPAETTAAATESGAAHDNPPTGDTAAPTLFIALAIVALLAGAGITIGLKKKEN